MDDVTLVAVVAVALGEDVSRGVGGVAGPAER